MSRRPRTVAVALLVTLVAAGGCAADQEELQSGVMGANARVGDVLLRSVHVEAPRDTRYPAGADARLWFTVVNEADRADTLTSITSPVASRVEIRWDADCTGQPQPVRRLPLRPAGPDPAAPGTGVPPFDAYHGHIVDLNREVLAGTTIEMVFQFARAGRVAVDAAVQPSNAPRAEPSLRCAVQPTTTGAAGPGPWHRAPVCPRRHRRRTAGQGDQPDQRPGRETPSWLGGVTLSACRQWRDPERSCRRHPNTPMAATVGPAGPSGTNADGTPHEG